MMNRAPEEFSNLNLSPIQEDDDGLNLGSDSLSGDEEAGKKGHEIFCDDFLNQISEDEDASLMHDLNQFNHKKENTLKFSTGI